MNKNKIQRIKTKCDNCNKELELIPYLYNRSVHHYCNKQCQHEYEARENFEDRKCIECGNEFHCSKRDKKKFCCKECELNYKYKQSHENRICESCGEEFECVKSSKKRFCNTTCQSKWQSTYSHILNPRIRETEIKCEWCGNKYKEWDYKIKAEQHNFCREKCRQEWFAKDYSQRESTKIASQSRAINMLEEGFFNQTDTRCQKVVDKILSNNNIAYINEKGYDNIFAVDNYLTDYNLIIEVMGTYWHTDPRKYKTIGYDMQVDRIRRDKAKHSYFRNNHNIEVLYLWEEDIMNNSPLCKELIKEYIDNKGKLVDYQSFNYILKNNKLELIENIIIPYSEFKAEELNEIIDLSVKQQMSRKQEDKWTKYNCETCGKECEELTSHYKLHDHHYCSQECTNKNRRVEVECKQCGKSFIISKSRYDNEPLKEFACSRECLFIYKKQHKLRITTIEKIKKSKVGQYTKGENANSKKVLVYNNVNELIKTFNSVLECAEWMVEIGLNKTIGTAKDYINKSEKNNVDYKGYYFKRTRENLMVFKNKISIVE